MKKTSCALLAAIALFCVLLSFECYAATYAYVSNSGDDTVSVISTSDNTVTDTVEVGDTPWGVAVNPIGDYVYVTNKLDATVSVISTYYNTETATIDVGSDPLGVAVTPNGDYVYVANSSDDNVSVISASTEIKTVTVGDAPSGVAVNPNGDYVYVTNNLAATVSVISTFHNELDATVDVGSGPLGVAVTPSGDYVYVANNLDDNASVIRTSDDTVIATVRVGNGPWGVAVDPSGDYVYVTNNLADTVSVISTSNNSVTATVRVGNGPWGVAVDLDGDYVYVANNSGATVSVINTSDNSIADTISVGNSPVGLGKFIGGKPLQAPSDLVATTVSDEEIDLSWNDNSYDELGFKIERKKNDETFTEIDTASAHVTSYGDTELSSDTTYYYRVRAYNDVGNSDYSNEADATTDEEESDDCVISAAAHGSPLEPHVKILRDFRDDFLLSNTVGKSFMHLYYAYSPPVAGFIARHDSLRGMVRLSLLPFIGVSWVGLKLGRVLTMALIVLLLALISATAVVLFREIRMRGHRAQSNIEQCERKGRG